MYRLKLIHSHPPRMRRRLMTSWWRFWHRLHIFDYVCIHFFWNNIFALFKPLWFFSVQTCVGVSCLRSRGNNESSTWDSTRLQTVVFVMWSFWPFVSCPATQYATTCNNFKIFEIPCNKNSNKVSCHVAHAMRYCHNWMEIPTEIPWMQCPEEWRTNRRHTIFLTN